MPQDSNDQMFPIGHGDRVISMDYWRGIAILAVVLYHFNDLLPFGYLGVDLFFVLSGFLVARTIIHKKQSGFGGATIFDFYLKRATKILPSYYFFLVAGSALCFWLYSESHPNLQIQGSQWWKFLFFFQNYRGTSNFVFDHAWSLCVEEHFYLAFPLAVFALYRFFPAVPFSYAAGAGILVGWAGRSFSYSIGFETYSATHNRIDGLAMGVLLACLEPNLRNGFLNWSRRAILASSGGAVFLVALGAHLYGGAVKAIAFHGLTVISFSLLLLATYGLRTNALKPLQWISKYSYNWYLWHLILLYQCQSLFGTSWIGLTAYLISGFALAMLATHLVEEPGLRLRKLLKFRNQINENSPKHPGKAEKQAA